VFYRAKKKSNYEDDEDDDELVIFEKSARGGRGSTVSAEFLKIDIAQHHF
jgi:hypothetical protein